MAANDESEPFIESYVFGPVGFQIPRGVLLFEIFDISVHQCRTDSLTLSRGGDAYRPEMHVRLFRIEAAPSREPLDELRKRLAERL